MFVPDFKILGAVVPEKYLTLSLCITFESEIGKKKSATVFGAVVPKWVCWGFTAQSTQWGHVERSQFT